MEQTNSFKQLLELISKPTFCVKNGVIIYTNQAARSMLLEIDTPIKSLMPDNADIYDNYQNGCLCLPLTISGTQCLSTINRTDDIDIITIEDPNCNDQLRTLSLAGQKLRLPLSCLIGSCDSMFMGKAFEALPYVDAIRHEINQLHRVINNMSDAATLDKRTASNDLLAPGSILDEILEKFRFYVCGKNITINYEPLSSPVITLGNRDLLERAIYNMLSNAVKFSDPVGTITIKAIQSGTRLHISIYNPCKNADSNMFMNVFSGYQRKPAIEDGRKGIGLGMTIISAAAQAHSGSALIDIPCSDTVRTTLTLTIHQPEGSTLLRDRTQSGFDYSSGNNRALLELSDILPAASYNYDTK